MHNRVVSSGFISSIVALLVGSVFNTYGAWGLMLTQAETTAGRWIIAISIGIFLAWVYSFFRNNFFVQSTPAFRGVAFGLLVWLATLVLATLIEEFRVFAFKVPVGSTLFLTAIWHAIWGGVLASSYEAGGEVREIRTAARVRRTR
jgi:hypothetical protein